MTFWLDAQLDPELAAWLGATFKVIAKAIAEVGLRDASDEELFEAGRRFAPITIITKDEDFSQLVSRLGPPPHIVWLRCGNMSTLHMRSLLSMTFPQATRHVANGAALVEINASGDCRVAN